MVWARGLDADGFILEEKKKKNVGIGYLLE